jgi:conjugative relaxase-like TrwC/TraI family protein
MGLNMTAMKGESEQVRYPWQEVEESVGRETYFLEEGRAEVRWMGDASGRGFNGEPTADAAVLLLGSMTASGERLARPSKEEFIDFTFSIGKDLSLLAVLGSEPVREAIERARTRAIDRTLEVFHRDYLVVRRGSGKDEANRRVERAASWAGIRYQHSFSRFGEPLLHDHVHISTLVQNRDGGFQRLWSPALFPKGGTVVEALGHRHEAELREAISQELPGIQWTGVGENGTAYVEQVPDELRDALSSRRRKDIEPRIAAWEAANGMRATSGVREWISKDTRQKKDLENALTREQVETIASEWGLDHAAIELGIVHAKQAPERSYESARQIADRLLHRDGLTRMRTTFRLPAVQVAVTRAGVPASKVDEYVSAIVGDERAHTIESIKGIKWTTTELVDAERSLIALLTSGDGEALNLVVNERVINFAIASDGTTANEGQRAALRELVGSANRVVLIEASAGTGKTFVAGLANKVWQREGIAVLGAAPTGKAVTELKGAGIEASRTFASLANHIRQGRPLNELTDGKPGVLLGDELGMVHTREAELVLRTAVNEGFVIRGMGHSAQLESVQAGGWLAHLAEQHNDRLVKLDEVVRQTDRAEGIALNDVAARRPHQWVEYQSNAGRLKLYGLDAEDWQQAMLDATQLLVEHQGQVLLLTPTNKIRHDLNLLAQEQLRNAGMHTGRSTGVQTSEGDTIHMRETLILKRNDRELGIDNGMRVTAIGAGGNGTLWVEVGDRPVQLPAEYVQQHVRLGYAVTIHDSQGVTVDDAIVVAPVNSLDSHLGYVAASRARNSTTMLLLGDPDPGWRKLKASLRRDTSDELAITQLQSAHDREVEPTPLFATSKVDQLRAERAAATDIGEQLRLSSEIVQETTLEPWALAVLPEPQLGAQSGAAVSPLERDEFNRLVRQRTQMLKDLANARERQEITDPNSFGLDMAGDARTRRLLGDAAELQLKIVKANRLAIGFGYDPGRLVDLSPHRAGPDLGMHL